MNKMTEIGNGAEATARPLMGTTNADAVLTVDEIAEELRCSRAHVYNAINGKVSGISALRVISMGRRVLIRRSSFELWKEENERMREQEPCGK
jgi:excisionase family DNA binding protein